VEIDTWDTTLPCACFFAFAFILFCLIFPLSSGPRSNPRKRTPLTHYARPDEATITANIISNLWHTGWSTVGWKASSPGQQHINALKSALGPQEGAGRMKEQNFFLCHVSMLLVEISRCCEEKPGSEIIRITATRSIFQKLLTTCILDFLTVRPIPPHRRLK